MEAVGLCHWTSNEIALLAAALGAVLAVVLGKLLDLLLRRGDDRRYREYRAAFEDPDQRQAWIDRLNTGRSIEEYRRMLGLALGRVRAVTGRPFAGRSFRFCLSFAYVYSQ